jgi:hypothetical protein
VIRKLESGKGQGWGDLGGFEWERVLKWKLRLDEVWSSNFVVVGMISGWIEPCGKWDVMTSGTSNPNNLGRTTVFKSSCVPRKHIKQSLIKQTKLLSKQSPSSLPSQAPHCAILQSSPTHDFFHPSPAIMQLSLHPNTNAGCFSGAKNRPAGGFKRRQLSSRFNLHEREVLSSTTQ